ncbi:hypothetical protein ACFLRZ_03460, partial [Bacteroidota bacterium]
MVVTIIYMIINKLNFWYLFKEISNEFFDNEIIENHKLMFSALFNRLSRKEAYSIKNENLNFEEKYNMWRRRRLSSNNNIRMRNLKSNNFVTGTFKDNKQNVLIKTCLFSRIRDHKAIKNIWQSIVLRVIEKLKWNCKVSIKDMVNNSLSLSSRLNI